MGCYRGSEDDFFISLGFFSRGQNQVAPPKISIVLCPNFCQCPILNLQPIGILIKWFLSIEIWPTSWAQVFLLPEEPKFLHSKRPMSCTWNIVAGLVFLTTYIIVNIIVVPIFITYLPNPRGRVMFIFIMSESVDHS